MQLRPELREAWKELLAVSTPDEISDWTTKYGDKKTKNRESQTLEYKVKPHRENILKACCEFANSIGGIVLVGVADELTTRDPKNEIKGGCNILDEERRDYRSDLFKYIREGFYYSFPRIEIEYIKSAKVTAILVYGNERELLLTKTSETGLNGFRRRGDNSDPFSAEEIIAIADRFYRQRDMLLERYRRWSHLMGAEVSSYRKADLIVSSLPIQAFSTMSSARSLETFARLVDLYLPKIRLTTSSDGMCLMFETFKDSQTISFYSRIIDDGLYHIHLESYASKVEGIWTADAAYYARLLVIALYFCMLQANHANDSKSWAIQGIFYQFDTKGKPKRTTQSEPVLLNLPPEQMLLDSPFPEIDGDPNKPEQLLRILRHISDVLGLDLDEREDSKQLSFEDLAQIWRNEAKRD